eukprot:1147821-Pelagomonas_calceolata.AAC.10
MQYTVVCQGHKRTKHCDTGTQRGAHNCRERGSPSLLAEVLSRSSCAARGAVDCSRLGGASMPCKDTKLGLSTSMHNAHFLLGWEN